MAMMSAFDLRGKDGCHRGVVDISRQVQNPRGCEGFGVVSNESWVCASPLRRLILGGRGRGFFLGILAAEALYATGGIDQLLLASEEGMAG